MSYIGDFRLGETFDTKFTTRQISGAPSTLASSPVISAYVGNSTTQLTAGITLSVDFDSVTGLNNVRVVATSGNGYATASNYQLVITVGTVNSVSVVGEVIAEFSIENRSALMPTTAARTLVVDAAGLADANAVKLGPSGSGTAQTARDLGASVLLSPGTGTGQISLTSGAVTFGNTSIATVTNLTNAPTAGDFTATMKTSIGTAVAASAVASVTGNVGGNVTGTVGSVVGAVGSVTAAVAITSNIKRNQALAGFTFLMTDATTHAPMTGLTITVTRSIDGAAFAAGTLANAAELSNGIYSVDFGAGDLNGKTIILRVTATGADDSFERIITQV